MTIVPTYRGSPFNTNIYRRSRFLIAFTWFTLCHQFDRIVSYIYKGQRRRKHKEWDDSVNTKLNKSKQLSRAEWYSSSFTGRNVKMSFTISITICFCWARCTRQIGGSDDSGDPVRCSCQLLTAMHMQFSIQVVSIARHCNIIDLDEFQTQRVKFSACKKKEEEILNTCSLSSSHTQWKMPSWIYLTMYYTSGEWFSRSIHTHIQCEERT